jgi:hypothetical protein
VADTLKEDYEKLHEEIVKASAVNADETGFRIDGKNSWLWVFTSTMASFYKVAPTRGHTMPEETLTQSVQYVKVYFTVKLVAVGEHGKVLKSLK